MRTHSTVRSGFLLAVGVLSTSVFLAACGDDVDVDGSGSQLGSGGKAGSAGAAGSTGGTAGSAGKAGTAGSGGSAGTGGGVAGNAGSAQGGASSGGAAGAPAGGAAGVGGGAGAPAGGSAGAGADAGSAGASGEAGAAGSAGVGGGGEAGSAGTSGGSGAGGSSGSTGSAGGAGGTAAGSSGASGGGGAGGAPTCGDATVASACASPLFPASAPQCLTKFDLPQPGNAPLAFPCFTSSVVPNHGLVGTVARVRVEATSRIVVWRSHSSFFDKTYDHMGLATDDCAGSAGACLGVGTYGDIVTAEVGPGDYQIQGEVAALQPNAPLRYLVEAPPPAPTNTSCATATPIGGPWKMALQPRVVDTQSRHFSVASSSQDRKLAVSLGSPMNMGKATARVREACGGPVISEGMAPYMFASDAGTVALTFQAAANKTYEIEVTGLTPGVSFGIGLRLVP